MHESPVNFFVIRIGSHWSFSDKYVRSVVPAGASRKPELKSWMTRATYASSSTVHFPRRSRFLLLGERDRPEDVVVMTLGGPPPRWTTSSETADSSECSNMEGDSSSFSSLDVGADDFLLADPFFVTDSDPTSRLVSFSVSFKQPSRAS